MATESLNIYKPTFEIVGFITGFEFLMDQVMF